jgi:phosphoinositide-3-kinase regulatory subunit 4
MIFFHEKTVKAAATAETGVSRDERSSVPSKTPLTKQLSSYAESGYQHHIDCINDVAFTELPHPMIISAGRDGVIKVWK